MYFLKFSYTLLYLVFYVFNNRRKELQWGISYLRALERKFDGSFDERTFKKILFYYSLMVPAVSDAFLSLYKRRTSENEKERLLHYFLCTSVFDNFFDRNELTDSEIFDITFNTQNWKPKNFTERVSINSHFVLSNFVRNKTYFFELLKKVYDIQVDSRKQFDISITNKELEHITLDKGGNAVLLPGLLLDNDVSEFELQTRYLLGGIIQYVNDLYDIYRDLQNGIETIPTRLTSTQKFKHYYLQLVEELNDKIDSIPEPRKIKLKLKISAMGIAALGIIAIDQLQKLEDSSQQLPNLKQVPRKALIVDMEKVSNIWKLLKITYKLSK